MKYFSFFAVCLLLTVISPFTLAKFTSETLQQKIEGISLTDENAEQKTLALLSSLQDEQEPVLIAQTLLFLMKVQQQKKHYDDVKTSYKRLALITEKDQFKKIQAEALFILVKNERMLENNKAALKIIEDKGIPEATRYAPELLADFYNEAANNAAVIPDFERFDAYFQLTIDTLKAKKRITSLARVLASKGNYLASYGNIKAALPVLISATRYQLELDDKQGLFSSYRALGRLNHEIENYQQAIEYFKKANDLNLESTKHLASLNYSLAFTYYELQQYDDAIVYIDKALHFMVESSSKRNLAFILLGKASILIKKQNFSASLTILEKVNSMVMAKALKSTRIKEDLQLNYAKYFLAIGDMPSAIKSVQASIAIEIPRVSMNIDKYKTASEIYEQSGDYKKSLFYLRKLRALELEKSKVKDEKRVVQQQNEINLLNAQKNTVVVKQQLLEKQNQVQLQQAEQQRLWFYGSIFILCLFALFSFFYLRQSQKKRIALEQSKLVMAIMEQKNNFIANVAHDLKNPLTVIQIHLEALKDGMVKNSDQAHDILNQRLAELTNSIDDLRQVSLLEMGALTLTPKALVFKTWLQQEISAYRPLVESKGLSFRTTIKLDRTASVIADPSRLSQVFANIIKNSLRYTHRPGKLTIVAKQHQQNIILIIKDSAPAVAESELTEVFKHGYRSESTQAMSTQGSGLGLFICKEIVEAHQGSISASLSNLGGLNISIMLPLSGEF